MGVEVGAFRILASVLFVICIPVALFTTTIRYVANEPRVYRYAIDEYGAVATTGVSRDELIGAGADLRAYFNNGQDEPSIRVDPDRLLDVEELRRRFGGSLEVRPNRLLMRRQGEDWQQHLLRLLDLLAELYEGGRIPSGV